jgi:hypothetical protein
VAYFLKEKTVEPEKQPLLGNGCVTRSNGVTVGSGVFVRSVPRLYHEDQLSLRESHETAVRRGGGWWGLAVSLRGREPESKGRSAWEAATKQRSEDRD